MKEIPYSPNVRLGYFNPRELTKDLLITGASAVVWDFLGGFKIDNIIPNIANGAGTVEGLYLENSTNIEHRNRSVRRSLAFGVASLIGRVLFCEHENWWEYPLDGYLTMVRYMAGSLPPFILSTFVSESDMYEVHVKTDSGEQQMPTEIVKVEYPIGRKRI